MVISDKSLPWRCPWPLAQIHHECHTNPVSTRDGQAVRTIPNTRLFQATDNSAAFEPSTSDARVRAGPSRVC